MKLSKELERILSRRREEILHARYEKLLPSLQKKVQPLIQKYIFLRKEYRKAYDELRKREKLCNTSKQLIQKELGGNFYFDADDCRIEVSNPYGQSQRDLEDLRIEIECGDAQDAIKKFLEA